MKALLTILLGAFLLNSVKAQNVKIQKATDILFASEMFLKYKEIKNSMEKKGAEVKLKDSLRISLRDSVQKAYNKVRTYCDDFLEKLINDFLTRKERKKMLSQTDYFEIRYSKSFTSIQNSYNEEFIPIYKIATDQTRKFIPLLKIIGNVLGIDEIIEALKEAIKQVLVDKIKKPFVPKLWAEL